MKQDCQNVDNYFYYVLYVIYYILCIIYNILFMLEVFHDRK